MYSLAERLATWMARACGLALLASVAMIAAEVVSRRLVGISLVGADEIAGYILAITVSWGCSLAIVRRAHVRIDILHAALPRGGQVVLDLLALVSLAAFALFLAWFATGLFENSWRTGAVSNSQMQVPRWIPHGLWAAGFWIFGAVTLVLIAEHLRALLRRDWDHAHRVAGVRGAQEEAQDETREAQGRV
jgi:TRAP-type C4-dicarboxylate transport system permease small subunit